MKNVLMLTCHFYPSNHIATQRPAQLAKYLPEYGWNPLIICLNWTRNNCEEFDLSMVSRLQSSNIVKSVAYGFPGPKGHLRKQLYCMSLITKPELFIARALVHLFHVRLEKYPPEFYYGAIRFLRDFLKSTKVDCVWATSPFLATHGVANWVKKTFAIPWIADFRDTADVRSQRWNERHGLSLAKAELRTALSSSAIVTVSEPLKVRLQEHHIIPVYVIPNGFDPEEYSDIGSADRRTLSIVYTGWIFKGRNPRPLFEALEMLICSNKMKASEVSVSFYGTRPDIIKGMLQGFRSVRNVVHVFPRITHQKVVAIQKRAQILLHLAHGDEKGIFTGKVFEYLGAGRPILCIPGDNDCVDALLEQTRAGIVCRNAEETGAQLLRWYEEWRKTGIIVFDGREEEIMKYSRREQARHLAKLLEQISVSSPNR